MKVGTWVHLPSSPLHVAGGGLVATDLAHVVEEGHQGDGLLAVPRPYRSVTRSRAK